MSRYHCEGCGRKFQQNRSEPEIRCPYCGHTAHAEGTPSTLFRKGHYEAVAKVLRNNHYSAFKSYYEVVQSIREDLAELFAEDNVNFNVELFMEASTNEEGVPQ